MHRPEVHGHRGSRGTHPENTMPSFQEAATCGAEFLELDLQLTADDVPMVFHDPAVTTRQCAAATTPRPVRELTAAELATFDIGMVPQPKFPQQKQLPGLHAPSLDDVLRWAKAPGNHIRLNIELKFEALSPEKLPDAGVYARKVVQALQAHGMRSRSRIQSFDFRPLRAAKKLEPALEIACLFEERRDFIRETLETGAVIVAPFHEFVTEGLIRDCHARNLRVIPWTVNDPARWDELTAWGIDGIITDYPRRLVERLGQKGQ